MYFANLTLEGIEPMVNEHMINNYRPVQSVGARIVYRSYDNLKCGARASFAFEFATLILLSITVLVSKAITY